MDDEALRIWLTAPENISEAGRWIQEHKVFAGTLKNSPKLRANVRKNVRVVKDGGNTLELIDFPQDRADRFFIRLTKGLLDIFYPEVDRQKLAFRMSHLTYATSGWSQFAKLRDASIHDSRGDGVFQFRHRVDRATGMGYWFFVFYEASLFSMWHQKGEPGATDNLDNAQ